VYLLFVDESGSHGGSHSFILGGLAVHEQDAHPLAECLDGVVGAALAGYGGDVVDHELHGAELRNAKSPASRAGRPSSPWAAIPRARRLDTLVAAYRGLVEFRPVEPGFPVALFGVVVDRRFRSSLPYSNENGSRTRSSSRSSTFCSNASAALSIRPVDLSFTIAE
jgi:hypothetical protein